MNTAEIRERHYSNPTAIQVNGVPIPCCQSCWAPWPCDAIRLCDEVDRQTAEIKRLRVLPTRDEIADAVLALLTADES